MPAGERAPEARGRRPAAVQARLTASERRLMLFAIDLLVMNTALLAVLALRFDYPFSWWTVRQAPVYFVLLTLVWWVWASFFDCYNLPMSADASQGAWTAGRAVLLTCATYLLIPYYTPYFTESRLSAVVFVGMCTVGITAWRGLYATVFSQPAFQQRVLIVGAGRSGAELARELAGKPLFGNPYAGSGFQVLGFVDDDPAKAGGAVEGVPVLGGRHELRRLVEDLRVDTLVLAVTHTPNIHAELFQALLDCREQGVRLEPMASLYERVTGKVPVDHAGRNLHVVLPLSESPMQRVFAAVKRLGDLGFAVLGLAALALVVPGVWLANALLCPGPLFYTQVRVGRGGRPFRILKLRSMAPDAEGADGAVWARSADSRVTPVGRWLRRSRLDELPQMWNVLRGEMSLVGPRPERPEFVAELARSVPFYQARHAVRPGLTGWAQVRYGYGASERDALVKLQHDLYYIKHMSLYLEVSILVKTAAEVLRLRGR